METLHDFFRALDLFLLDSIGYMVDNLLGSRGYREGFGAGILFLVVVAVLSQLIPYAWARILAYYAARQPSLHQGPAAATLGGGCAGGGLILLALALVAMGMLCGLIGE